MFGDSLSQLLFSWCASADKCSKGIWAANALNKCHKDANTHQDLFYWCPHRYYLHRLQKKIHFSSFNIDWDADACVLTQRETGESNTEGHKTAATGDQSNTAQLIMKVHRVYQDFALKSNCMALQQYRRWCDSRKQINNLIKTVKLWETYIWWLTGEERLLSTMIP